MNKVFKFAISRIAVSALGAAVLALSLGGAALLPGQAFGKIYKGKVLGDKTTSSVQLKVAPNPNAPPAPPAAPTPPVALPPQANVPGSNTAAAPTAPAVNNTSLPKGLFRQPSPNVFLSLPGTGSTGAAVTATGGVGNAVNVPFAYLFLWGDGNYDLTQIGVNSASHTYNNPGTYQVVMMALIDSNVAGTATGSITISGSLAPAAPIVNTAAPVTTPTPAPTVPAAVTLPLDLQINLPSTVSVGKSFTVSAQVNNYNSPVSVAFSWGNGNYALTQLGNPSVTYTYNKAGNYFVRVSVTINGNTLTKTGWINVQ